ATLPELAPAGIIVRDQNNRPLNSRVPQSREAFLHQTLTQSDSLIPRMDCEMINMSAPAIMAAQRHTYDRRSIGCDPTQSRIPAKKPRDAFFVIALRNLEPLNSFSTAQPRHRNRRSKILSCKSCPSCRRKTTLACTERF